MAASASGGARQRATNRWSCSIDRTGREVGARQRRCATRARTANTACRLRLEACTVRRPGGVARKPAAAVRRHGRGGERSTLRPGTGTRQRQPHARPWRSRRGRDRTAREAPPVDAQAPWLADRRSALAAAAAHLRSRRCPPRCFSGRLATRRRDGSGRGRDRSGSGARVGLAWRGATLGRLALDVHATRRCCAASSARTCNSTRPDGRVEADVTAASRQASSCSSNAQRRPAGRGIRQPARSALPKRLARADCRRTSTELRARERLAGHRARHARHGRR